jgi:hypothetical protein
MGKHIRVQLCNIEMVKEKSMCIIVLECNDGDDDALLNLMFEQLQIVDVMCMTIVPV